VVHGGRITSILVMMQDQSEQEQIRMHAQHLEQRAVLGEVTAIFAHEVRNPINNISTGLQLMAYNLPENDPHQETIARLQQDCDRLTELMKGVLSFSRPTEYEMEQIQLDKLVAHWLERLHPRMARINVTHHFQAEANCPAVMGNARALEQVFNNLMTNALQAMSETGGDLAVKVHTARKLVEWDSYSEHRTYVEVSIADTGPGIPREMQERVFHPFFTTNRNGTGLGLAIAKRILTAHKGNIRLTSFPGGTIFYVELPAVGE
jgi:signal transduction histidine kinase